MAARLHKHSRSTLPEPPGSGPQFVEDIADKATNEDTQLQFTFNVGAGAVASVTASSSNTGLVPNSPANIAVAGSGSSRTLTINPVANQFGTSTITVTVNDSSGDSMTDTFVLTVNAVNDAPSFAKGADQTVKSPTPPIRSYRPNCSYS